MTQAKQAKELMVNAQIAEEEGLNQLYKQLAEIGETPSTPIGMPKVDVGQVATENSTIDGNKGTYDNPIIPKGFKAVNQGTAVWTERTGYTNGLVIEDATSDAITKGSQFVWVPVMNYNNFYIREGYQEGLLQTLLSEKVNPAREAGASKMQIFPGKPSITNTVLRNRGKCSNV